MEYKTILFEKKDRVAKITLNRPRVLNALSGELKQELLSAIKAIKKDASIKALVITGSGDRAFSSGQDLSETKDLKPELAKKWVEDFGILYDEIKGLDIPYIAAINGVAVGAGCQLALLADMRICADTGRLGMTEINVGLACILGGTLFWELMGPSKTIEMIMTGEIVDAKEAWRVGLVNKVVPAADLQRVTEELATKLAELPRVANTMNKRWFRELTRERMKKAIDFAVMAHTEGFKSGEPQECMKAFFEKRKPKLD